MHLSCRWFYCLISDNLTLMNDRKLQHIELTNSSQAEFSPLSDLFYYEPLHGAHAKTVDLSVNFAGKKLSLPLWISSMTGGTGKAKHINNNLSKVAGNKQIGFGLGSCRPLLESDVFFDDFHLKHHTKDAPYWANLGVAQVSELLSQGRMNEINNLLKRLEVDGLIIHVNPLQEWMQPEGDVFVEDPLTTIKKTFDKINFPIIVKEVGQGMGPRSLKSLMELPLMAIEFAAYGGTNFTTLEKLRSIDAPEIHDSVTRIGHTALDMVEMTNKIIKENPSIKCQDFIISGGVREYLTGYYLMNKSLGNCVFGMASPFLNHADQGVDKLEDFVNEIEKGLQLANQYLSIRN